MLCRLLATLDRQRWEPVVVSLTDGSQPEEWLRAQGITVYTLGLRAGKLPSVAGFLRMLRLVRRHRPNLIQGWMYHGNLAAQLVKMVLYPFRRVAVIWSIHHSPGTMAGEKKMTAGIIRLGARLSRLPDKIGYASVVSREQHVALGYYDRKAMVIPNGVDVEVFVPSREARAAVREELGIPAQAQVIGSLARYHPMKGHANFLQAAGMLASRLGFEDVVFLLAGAGVDDRNEELRSLPGALLLGERADTARLLAAMDIFTVASLQEAGPIVLLEAMSCGVACVTTEVGFAGMALGDAGIVIPPGDAVALADAWARLIDVGEEERRRLGALGRMRVINGYSLSAYASAYEGVYQSLTP
jgi:glycosyltransferase involved in cell wall biosynthesis